jgi:large subunit ribosomal protein L21
MYAIVKTGGKQYRVEQGQSLLVERLPVDDGGNATLQPLLYVDGDNIVDGEELAKVSVQARVVGHERGPKLRVVKFKPKRGYRRRTGHRQDLTRIEVTEIKLAARRPSSRRASKPVAAEAPAKPTRPRARKPTADAEAPPSQAKPARRKAAAPTEHEEAQTKPARRSASTQADAPAKPARPRRKRAPSGPEPEDGNGA